MLYILIQLTVALLSPVQLLSPFTYGKPCQTKCLTACGADDPEAANSEQHGEHLSVFMYYIMQWKIVTLQGSPVCVYLIADKWLGRFAAIVTAKVQQLLY